MPATNKRIPLDTVIFSHRAFTFRYLIAASLIFIFRLIRRYSFSQRQLFNLRSDYMYIRF